MSNSNDPDQHGDNPYDSSGDQQPGGAYQRGSYHSASFDNDSSAPRIGAEARESGKGFFGALFDISFDSFIAVKFARFIYVLAIIFALLSVLMFWVFPTIALFTEEVFAGFLWLLVGWVPAAVIALFQLIAIRLFLEFVVATIKTANNTSHLAANLPR